jgi:hypothetical protein
MTRQKRQRIFLTISFRHILHGAADGAGWRRSSITLKGSTPVKRQSTCASAIVVASVSQGWIDQRCHNE